MAQSDDDPIKRAKALFLNQDDERAALFEDANSERHRVAWAAFKAYVQRREEQSQRRRENPWLLDIIIVLLPSRQMNTQAVERKLTKLRKAHGIEPTKEFWASARNVYNSRCEGHNGFEKEKKKNPQLEPLFYSPERGIWAVHHDRASAWVEKKYMQEGESEDQDDLGHSRI